ncbi:MAG TPA: hypothetical protein VK171_06590 [Fimbriimonas sp.]|nr:hypothetical protein [Fimbriimonas sp.]
MKSLSIFALLALVVVGCGSSNSSTSNAPREGSMKLDNLPPDQKVKAVQDSNEIPEQYKQTYINSVQSQQGAGAPAAPPTGQ